MPIFHYVLMYIPDGGIQINTFLAHIKSCSFCSKFFRVLRKRGITPIDVVEEDKNRIHKNIYITLHRIILYDTRQNIKGFYTCIN
jgi:hypothetical protein